MSGGSMNYLYGQDEPSTNDMRSAIQYAKEYRSKAQTETEKIAVDAFIGALQEVLTAFESAHDKWQKLLGAYSESIHDVEWACSGDYNSRDFVETCTKDMLKLLKVERQP